MNCQHCQPLLLDHLYGLLDGPEAAAVDAHLASCPACAAARAEAARVQGLIASAAKSAFPNTRFEAPAPEAPAKVGTITPAPAASAPTTTLPVVQPKVEPAVKPGRSFSLGTVLPWAIAAAVLVAIPGTVVPVLGIFRDAEIAKNEAEIARRNATTASAAVDTARAEVHGRQTAAERHLAAAEQSQNLLLGQWVEAQRTALQTAAARKLTVDVLKPATVQPGAPNDFVVVVNDQREQWERGKKLVAEIHAVNASDAVIFTQPIDSERAADNKHPLRLPAGAWTQIKPDAELFLVVAQLDEKTQTRTELLDRVRLAGPVFATLLVTDKATYRPGERLFFRSLTLDRVTFRPPGREQVLRYELRHPDGRPVGGLHVYGTTDLVRVGPEGKVEPVRTADGQPVRGVGCGEFVLPPELPDGDYTLVLHEHSHPGGFPPAVTGPVKRTVTVRRGVVEHYRKQIEFVGRASYAPGETVEALAKLEFQDRPVPNAQIIGVTATVDGQVIGLVESAKVTDANGRATFRFALPEQVLNGDVQVQVAFRTEDGTEEVVAKRVPVVGNRVKVEFFPESGNTIVAGVPCKVYVRATTPAGTPVDIRGVVTDGRQVLARVETLTDPKEPGANRGLGAFTYTPELGTRVWLKLEAPAGTFAPILPEVPVPHATVALLGGPGAVGRQTGFELPMPKPEGVVMTILDPVTAPGQPIRVRLHSVGHPRQLVVGAYTRGRLSDTQKVNVDPEAPRIVELMAGADPRGGVVRVTVFEEVEARGKGDEPLTELKPVAERLVFRKPGEKLTLTCAPVDGRNSVPAAPAAGAGGVAATVAPTANGTANLSVTATDESGQPAAAILWAAIVNTAAAPGPKDRLMPTHFLLAGEVKNPDDLEHADFLLNETHPKAAQALDLLLGTQGWRRFAEQSPPTEEVRAKPAPKPPAAPSEVVRLQAQNGQIATWSESGPSRALLKLNETFAPRYEAAVQAVARAKAARDAARAEGENPQPVAAATKAAEAAQRSATQKALGADSAREPVRQFRANVWYGVAGLAALALCCGGAALGRPSGRFPLGFSTVGALGLACFLTFAAEWGDDAQASAKRDAAPAMAQRSGTEANQFSMKEADALVPTEDVAPASRMKEAPTGKSKFGAVGGKMAADAGMEMAMGGAKGGFAGGFGGPPPGGFGGRPGVPGGPGGPGPTAMPGGGVGPGSPGGAVPGGPPLPKPGPPMGLPGAGGSSTGPKDPPGLTAPAPAGIAAADPGPGVAALGPTLGPARGKDKTGPNTGFAPADLGTGQSAMKSVPGATDPADLVADLKRTSEQAAAYTAERARTLAGPLDAYMQDRARAKKDGKGPGAGPGGVERLIPGERFVGQSIRGAVSPVVPLVVREYAAPRPGAAPLPDESPDTVLWQPVIVLPSDGRATLTFHLGSARGGYQVMVAGHTADGRLGAVRELIIASGSPSQPPVLLGPGGSGVPGGSVPPVIPVAPMVPAAPAKPPMP